VLLVIVVARSLVRPLRRLRDSALKVAHDDLAREIERVRAGGEAGHVQPIPVYTSEEVGQVAHAVDELHEQAVMLASEQSQLQLQVSDMFETLSRRSRSLVDQQLSLIDRLERNEEDPQRLEALLRLDHLAARMRRNGANLLVLAGSKVPREQADPVPVAAVINAAASEVEDYNRVVTAVVPESDVHGAVAGDLVHLLAELLDNALRYSPPASPVRVSAGFRSDGAVLLQIVDVGLGMTDGDRRIANMRLRAGGEVSPDSARHMGLFVVGRLANRHDIRVRLRGSSVEEARSGTTAEVYLPAAVLAGADAGPVAAPEAEATTAPRLAPEPVTPEFPVDRAADAADRNGSQSTDSSISLLPRRRPGGSGITGAPAAPPDLDEPAIPAEPAPTPPAAQPVSNTSSFFGSRVRLSRENRQPPIAEPPAEPEPPETDDVWTAEAAPPADPPDDDLIYKQMLSEWLVDPHDLAQSPDLDWQTVWDRGWSAAAEAEDAPVEAHTEHGLPVRDPGARLVPGGGEPNGNAHHRADDNGTNGGSGSGHTPAHGVPLRDPEAVRASMSSHFGGVRAGRSHARDDDQGSE